MNGTNMPLDLHDVRHPEDPTITSQSQVHDPEWVTVGICHACSHQYEDGTCAAFPDGIPHEIVVGLVDHSKPYDGDHGIQFLPWGIHADNPKYIAKKAKLKAAGLVIVARDTGRILMLQRSLSDDEKFPDAAGKWEFPGGRLEDGETAYDAAKREWAEEVGQPVPKGHLIGSWVSDNGVYQGFVYRIKREEKLHINADPKNRGVLNPDDPDQDEIETVAWLDPAHVQDWDGIREECKTSDWDLIKQSLKKLVGAAMVKGESAGHEFHGNQWNGEGRRNELEGMKASQLREILGGHGHPTSYGKPELVNRILAHEEKMHGQSPVPQGPSEVPHPKPAGGEKPAKEYKLTPQNIHAALKDADVERAAKPGPQQYTHDGQPVVSGAIPRGYRIVGNEGEGIRIQYVAGYDPKGWKHDTAMGKITAAMESRGFHVEPSLYGKDIVVLAGAKDEPAKDTGTGKLPSSFSDLHGMEKIPGPTGSNGGQWYRDPGTGKEYLVKPAMSADHAQNEIAAGVVYREAGAAFPQTGLIQDGTGKQYVISEKIDGLKQLSAQSWKMQPDLQEQAAKHFGVDALLSHWDVHGLTGDNTLVAKDGTPVRIESGGAMAFRAMGGPKESFSPTGKWVEPESMRTSDQGRAMYGHMTNEQAQASLREAAKLDLGSVKEKWLAAGVSQSNADKWSATLAARIAQINSLGKMLTVGGDKTMKLLRYDARVETEEDGNA